MDARNDTPRFDLSARTSEDEDSLQVAPEDLVASVPAAQKKKPEIKPTPPNPEFDARLFNALVSPVAPVRLNERSASARPSPPPDREDPPPAAAPHESRVVETDLEQPSHAEPVATDVDAVWTEAADAERAVALANPEPHPEPATESDSVAPETDASVGDPVLMVQPVEPPDAPSVHDWEPLPPPMRIVAGQDEPADHGASEQTLAAEAAVEPEREAEPEHGSIPSTKTWDPAAVDDPPTPVVSPVVVTLASTDRPDRDDEPDDAVLANPETDEAETELVATEEVEVDEPMPDPEPLLAASPEDLGPTPAHLGSPTPAIEKPARTGAWWTLPMMCLGLAIVACAILVPAADENRRDLHELAKLEQDVAYFQKQSEVNQQFLEHVSTDPTLAERLAQRQLRMTRADSRVVQMSRDRGPFSMSPYALVTITPPPPMPEYRPMGGFLSRYFLDTKGQIYLTGLGILLVAAGVILGGGEPRAAANDE